MKIRDEVVLILNPYAGSSESQRLATEKWARKAGLKVYIPNEIKELGLLVAGLSAQVKLGEIYGGDGTFFRLVNACYRKKLLDSERRLVFAPIGGGTMKRLSHFTGWVDEPVLNAQRALELYKQQKRFTFSTPLLSVKWKKESYVGFTFLSGAVVRVMKKYSRYKTTPALAGFFSLAALGAGLLSWPSYFTRLYHRHRVQVFADSQELPEEEMLGTMADIMNTAIFHISPYRQERREDQFNCISYAVNYKELVFRFPQLAIGRPPSASRYFNAPTRELIIVPDEDLEFTIDGEFFQLPAKTRLEIRLGPTVDIMVNVASGLRLPLFNRFRLMVEDRLDRLQFVWPSKKNKED